MKNLKAASVPFVALLLLFFMLTPGYAAEKVPLKALYVPLADHYAALVAYEKYRDQMKYANFQLEQMKSWDLLRAYFRSGRVDMAFVMAPLAMDMYAEKPYFKWVGLMHRDGSALAINTRLNKKVKIAVQRGFRKPDARVAEAFAQVHKETGEAIPVGLPHLMSTHSVVLYRYLKDHGLTMSVKPNANAHVQALSVAPATSPIFLQRKGLRNLPAAFVQSLPWADVVESQGSGHVAWYSKDIIPWQHGHVECIAIATNEAIKNKAKAIREVMFYIQQAGADIEKARAQKGEALEEIVRMVRKHIPAHNRDAIIASLDYDLHVINYQNLNVDKAGLKLIMDLAVEGKILQKPVDIDVFADTQFDVKQTELSK